MVDMEGLLPDFDTMYSIITGLGELGTRIRNLKNDIEQLEASCIRDALTNNLYWLDAKRPTITFCVEVVKVIGNTEGERAQLRTMRTNLSELEGEYEQVRERLMLERNKLDLYRTLSANERLVHL